MKTVGSEPIISNLQSFKHAKSIGLWLWLFFLALVINSCILEKFFVKSSSPKLVTIVPHPFEQADSLKSEYLRFENAFNFVSERQSLVGSWELMQIAIAHRPDSSGENIKPGLIEIRFESADRYNPKYDSPGEMLAQEWKKNGKSLLMNWQNPLRFIGQNDYALSIVVLVKGKNYLRPNQEMKNVELKFQIPPELLVQDRSPNEIADSLASAFN